jgi:ABC-type dipeptide/oligopeptide/nickel transport system ATPase subunit
MESMTSMRVLVFGNSGSGKTTYALALAHRYSLAHLDLDSIVWEPHKYSSLEQQHAMLENLQAWVAAYYTRSDPWSYQAHRRIFDAHRGAKVEYLSAPDIS